MKIKLFAGAALAFGLGSAWASTVSYTVVDNSTFIGQPSTGDKTTITTGSVKFTRCETNDEGKETCTEVKPSGSTFGYNALQWQRYNVTRDAWVDYSGENFTEGKYRLFTRFFPDFPKCGLTADEAA